MMLKSLYGNVDEKKNFMTSQQDCDGQTKVPLQWQNPADMTLIKSSILTTNIGRRVVMFLVM